MALIWRVHEPTPVHGFSWDVWYKKNKHKLADKRAKRYREDANYRTLALKRSREQRAAKKMPVDQHGHTVSFLDAAEAIGVTLWVLREWRRKDYFPEPYHSGGRLWFSPSQVQLLQQIRKFFDQHGRVTMLNRSDLENVVSLTYSNW